MKPTPLLLLFLLALLLPTVPARAQEGWLVPFAAAYQPDLAGFRQAFQRNKLPLPAERQYGWGIELRSLVGGFLVGPMYLRTWSDEENEGFQLRSEANAIIGQAGFKIAPANWFSVVPMLGLGGLNQSLHIRRSRTGDLPLDSLLGSPGRNATIESGLKLTGLAALELGVAVPVEAGSYGVSARVGYLYSPLDPGWHLANGARITDATRAGLRGPFITIGLLIIPGAEVTTGSF